MQQQQEGLEKQLQASDETAALHLEKQRYWTYRAKNQYR